MRDIAQFGVMLILVRLLSPADYGTAALAQAIVGAASVVSYGSFAGHALQMRNPADVDWQAHFTAGVVINILVATLMLIISWGLSFSALYHDAAFPLTVLTVMLFIVEVPGSLRQRMLETRHDWKRFRSLLMLGTLLGLGTGLAVGLAGGGVWAIVIQPPILTLPAAIDLFLSERFRPNWSWTWPRFRETAIFTCKGFVPAGLVRFRTVIEQTVLVAAFDLATLGVFSRAIGLATLLAGRIGSVAMSALYPVITRAEHGTERFRRVSSLVLRGVCWTTVPAVAFLTITAGDIVQLIYGSQWVLVIELLPLAAATIGIAGITATLSSVLEANEQIDANLAISTAFVAIGIALALWLIPIGLNHYLTGLVAMGTVFVFMWSALLAKTDGIDLRGLVLSILPAFTAASVAVGTVVASRHLLDPSSHLVLRLATDLLILSLAYVVSLRLAFVGPFTELLKVFPVVNFLCRICLVRVGEPSVQDHKQQKGVGEA